MLFADDVTMLGEVSPSVCSPVLEEPTPIVSAVVVDDVVIPEGETIGSSDVVPDVIPPRPGFPLFSFPRSSLVMSHQTVRFSVWRWWFTGRSCKPSECGAAVLTDCAGSCSESVRRTLSSWCLLWWMLVQIRWRMSIDQCLLCRPSKTSSCRIGCGRRLLFRLRMSAIVARPQYLGGGWLGRARSWWSDPESIRSLGAGCAFRNTSYRSPDYDAPSGGFGLPVHHPRFLEWIGVPQSTCLLDIQYLNIHYLNMVK